MFTLLSSLQSPFLLAAALGLPGEGIFQQPPCTATASLAAQAARLQTYEELLLQLAGCVNASSNGVSSDCLGRAWEKYNQSLGEAHEVFAARLALCDLIGEAPYNPLLDPSSFVDYVDHPFCPLDPGTTMIYERDGAEGLERIEVAVLPDKQTIEGVDCTPVRVTETLNGELTEVTFDWYAQDVSGNVWYFGESSMAFQDGVPISMEGSWRAGQDGAQPGIEMLAQPRVGETYRKEFKIGDAEDAATILEDGVSVSIGLGNYSSTLRVNDFSPLDPDDGEDEDKYYAPGVGLVLEIDNQTGERLELVEIVRG